MRPITITAAAAILLTACAPSAKKVETQAQDYRTRIELCSDTDSLHTLVEQAVAYAQTIADKGRGDEAAIYLADIQTAVEKKNTSVGRYFARARATTEGLPLPAAPADTLAPADSLVADSADSLAAAPSDSLMPKP